MPTMRTLKSFCGVNNTAFNMHSVWSYSSCMEVSKFSFRYLLRTSGLKAFSKYKAKEWSSLLNMREARTGILPLPCISEIQHHKIDSRTTSTSALRNCSLVKNLLHSQQALFPVCVSHMSGYRAYSSHMGKKHDASQLAEVSPAATAGESTVQTTDAGGNEWVDVFNRAYQATVDAAVNTGKMAKGASDELVPYINQLFESQPYLKNVVIPVGGTFSAAILAWLVMPRLLRRLHKYSSRSPVALFSPQDPVPYEKSLWGALEDPARYLTTFLAFSQLGVMIAPTTSQYLPQAWRGAVILSVVWFLHRWKTNVATLALANKMTVGLDRDKLLALDKLSSVGLLILGMMSLAEACGIAVQSILTVGGIGGVATAFAARDILGNLLSGLSLQFSQPFSIGDNIKAGSIEGQVVEMGLTTTSLINAEKFPVLVPNSLFSSQVIVNKTRAQWRAIVKRIPIRIDDLEKIPLVSEDIKSTLRSNPKVVLEMEAPYCFLSRIEDSYAELTVGCTLKKMKKDELYSTEQDILLQAAKIIKQHGAELGITLNDMTNHSLQN